MYLITARFLTQNHPVPRKKPAEAKQTNKQKKKHFLLKNLKKLFFGGRKHNINQKPALCPISQVQVLGYWQAVLQHVSNIAILFCL